MEKQRHFGAVSSVIPSNHHGVLPLLSLSVCLQQLSARPRSKGSTAGWAGSGWPWRRSGPGRRGRDGRRCSAQRGPKRAARGRPPTPHRSGTAASRLQGKQMEKKIEHCKSSITSAALLQNDSSEKNYCTLPECTGTQSVLGSNRPLGILKIWGGKKWTGLECFQFQCLSMEKNTHKTWPSTTTYKWFASHF